MVNPTSHHLEWNSIAVPSAQIGYVSRVARPTPAVLLVHGGLLEPIASQRFWIDSGVGDDLVLRGYQVIAVDHRLSGGRTMTDFEEVDWSVIASDLAAVIRHLDAGRVGVLAASNGCSAGLRLALDHPDLVSRMVLCWPATPGLPFDGRIQAGIAQAAAETARLGPGRFLESQFAMPMLRAASNLRAVIRADSRASASFSALAASEAARRMLDSGVRLLDHGLLRGVGRDELQSVSVPTVVVPATPDDPMHRRSTVDDVVARLPNARGGQAFPTIPHAEFPSRRAAYLTAITSWLGKD